MSTEQNKAVVRRFMTEVLQGGDLDVLEEVLAPNYVNRAMGDADIAGFKEILKGISSTGLGMHFTIVDMVAEGDLVIASFTSEITRASGKKLAADGLTLYRLADGKIVVDDPYTRPDLAQLLGMAPPAS